MADWTKLVQLIDAQKAAFDFEDTAAKEKYATDIKEEIDRIIARPADDRRKATEIAVDVAKMFVQLAIAAIVAIIGFVQFSHQTAPRETVIGLGIAAGLAFLSMCCGVYAISNAYKRGDGRTDKNKEPWSTEYLKGSLNAQAGTGVLALLVFGGAIVLFNVGGQASKLLITLPDKVTTTAAVAERLKFIGRWSDLRIEQQGRFTIQLGEAKDEKSVVIDAK